VGGKIILLKKILDIHRHTDREKRPFLCLRAQDFAQGFQEDLYLFDSGTESVPLGFYSLNRRGATNPSLSFCRLLL
jgi:hypothetical protein